MESQSNFPKNTFPTHQINDQNTPWDLDQENQALDDFLDEPDASGNYTHSYAPMTEDKFPKGEEDAFIEFSKNYNTTGPFAEKYKLDQQEYITSDNFSQNQFSTQIEQHPEMRGLGLDQDLSQQILEELKRNNQLMQDLTQRIENRKDANPISNDIISELKTNNLYLSRVEHKITQLLISLERILKG